MPTPMHYACTSPRCTAPRPTPRHTDQLPPPQPRGARCRYHLNIRRTAEWSGLLAERCAASKPKGHRRLIVNYRYTPIPLSGERPWCPGNYILAGGMQP